MNSVESAASLFGSDDTGPDPFAVLGGDDPETTPAQTADNIQGETLSAFDQPGIDVAAANLFSQEDSSSSSQYGSELGRHHTIPTLMMPQTIRRISVVALRIMTKQCRDGTTSMDNGKRKSICLRNRLKLVSTLLV
jgi:hypothetical protein